jgi:hypothetical protein
MLHRFFYIKLQAIDVSKGLLLAAFSIFLITLQSYSHAGLFQIAFAQSPSFVRQEITDKEGDWDFSETTDTLVPVVYNHSEILFAKRAADESECELGNFTLPNIKSVSFVSDGAMLNSTFWLNQSFLEPPYTKFDESPFLNDSMIHQEFLEVYVYPTNNETMEQVADDILKNTAENRVVMDLERSMTDIAGISAYNITVTAIYNGSYPYTTGAPISKIRDIIIIHNNTVYELIYEAALEKFDKGVPNFQKMVSSFHINNVTGSNSQYNTQLIGDSNYSTYTNSTYGITLQYPADWQMEENLFGNDNVITFFSPIQGAYLEYTTYGVNVFLAPVYRSSDSIEGYIQSINWNSNNQTWIESLREKSSSLPPGQQERIIYQKPIEGFFAEGKPWVNVLLELHKINSPSQYQATFSQETGFVKDSHYCILQDYTYLVSAPPPKFSITSNPLSPINVGPGEEKVIEIKIQSASDLVSHASLRVENKEPDIQDAYFVSDQIDIPPSGWAIAQLVIKGSTNYFDSTHPKTLNIVATMSSGDLRLVSAGGGSSAANEIPPNAIQETSALTLNVLSLYDYMLGGFSALNASGAVTIIIAIATFVGGFLSKEKLGGFVNSVRGGHSGSKDFKDGKQGHKGTDQGTHSSPPAGVA